MFGLVCGGIGGKGGWCVLVCVVYEGAKGTSGHVWVTVCVWAHLGVCMHVCAYLGGKGVCVRVCLCGCVRGVG